MFTSRRSHRSHLPGEDGGKDRRSPAFRHVSLSPSALQDIHTLKVRDPAVKLAHPITTEHPYYLNIDFLLPADINLRTKRRGKHWTEETSASCTTLGKLPIVLLVRDEILLSEI